MKTLASSGIKAMVGEALLAFAPEIAVAALAVGAIVAGVVALKSGRAAMQRNNDIKSGKDSNEVERAERMRDAKASGNAAKVKELEDEEKGYQAFKAGGFKPPSMGTPDAPNYEGGVTPQGTIRGRRGGGGGGGGDGSPVGTHKFGNGKLAYSGVDNASDMSSKLMKNLMTDFSLTKEQAAGIVGNLAHESGDFKHFNEVGGGGVGIAQWTGPRRKEFLSWCKQNSLEPQSYEANYGFLKHELNGSEAKSLEAVKKTHTVEESATAFERTNERAGVVAMGSRVSRGNAALKNFNEGGPEGGPDAKPVDGKGSISKAVLDGAKNLLAKGGDSQDVQNFMAKNGHPKSGAWCGEFTASLLESQGMPVPKNPQVASNWKTYGEHVDPKDIRPGDIAVKKRSRFDGSIVRPGDTGSHVGVVYGGIDQRSGHFKMLGGNQGKPVADRDMDEYEYRRAIVKAKVKEAEEAVKDAKVIERETKPDAQTEPRRLDPKSYAADPRMQDTISKDKPYKVSTMPDKVTVPNTVPTTATAPTNIPMEWLQKKQNPELQISPVPDAVTTAPTNIPMEWLQKKQKAELEISPVPDDGLQISSVSDKERRALDQNPTAGADLNAASTSQKISEGAKPSSTSSNITKFNAEHHDKKKSDTLLKPSNVAAADDHLKKMFSGYGAFA